MSSSYETESSDSSTDSESEQNGSDSSSSSEMEKKKKSNLELKELLNRVREDIQAEKNEDKVLVEQVHQFETQLAAFSRQMQQVLATTTTATPLPAEGQEEEQEQQGRQSPDSIDVPSTNLKKKKKKKKESNGTEKKVLKEGWLERKLSAQHWSRKYFKLDEMGNLMYYSEPKAAAAEGKVAARKLTIYSKVEQRGKIQPLLFHLHSEDTDQFLRASTLEEKEAWISMLKQFLKPSSS